jgi:predicted enzyme related to lactoylglutathione lyase
LRAPRRFKSACESPLSLHPQKPFGGYGKEALSLGAFPDDGMLDFGRAGGHASAAMKSGRNAIMAKVLGIGGLFFKSADPAACVDWYSRVLGLSFEEWGGIVFQPEAAAAHPGAATVFAPFAADSDYFAPSDAAFMVNLMVDDLDGILARCAEQGVVPLAPVLAEANGRFAHIMDPEGRKIELWQPKPMG